MFYGGVDGMFEFSFLIMFGLFAFLVVVILLKTFIQRG